MNLGGPIWKHPYIMALPILGKYSLFLISTHSENLIHLAQTVQKFKILEDTFEGGSHDFREISHNFRRDLVFLDIYNRSKFESCVYSSSKVDRKNKKEK